MRQKWVTILCSLIVIVIASSACNSSATQTENMASIDSDGDGWSDAQELQAGTDPYNVDTDGDGYWDPKDANPLDVNIVNPTPAQTPASITENKGVNYENVAEVVEALDKHSLSNGDKPYYQFIGAYDGIKYDVEPGDYRLEIYVYRALEEMAEMALQAQTVDNQVYIDKNSMLLLHTTNKDDLDRLVADLHDGQ